MPPRRSSFDQKLNRLKVIAEEHGATSASIDELRRTLGDPNGFLVGQAAQVAAQLGLHDLVPDMSTAFARLAEGSASADKGSLGKRRIIEALLALDAAVPSTYLLGLRVVQREPSGGGWIDVAAPVRSLSAHALIRIDHPTAIHDVTPLLMDSEAEVRAEAARALSHSGIELVAAILMLKAMSGEGEPEVLSACFKGMLRLAPTRYLSYVASRLRDAEEAEAEVAALSLGESRAPDALRALREAVTSDDCIRLRDALLLALALHRSGEANDVLLSLVESAPEALAASALSSLSLHRHDPDVEERARRIVRTRKSKKLSQVFKDKFEV